jgi:hypothetical protein
MTDRPQKITFAEMRDMGVRGLLIYCPTTAAATQSRSVEIVGPMISGCPISRRGLCAGPAASAVRMCGLISIGIRK